MEWTEYFAPLMRGAWVTIQLTVWSTIFGAILSFAAGIGKVSGNGFARWISIVYIEIFRGTSLLVQLFWLFFALPVAGQAIGVDRWGPEHLAAAVELLRGLNSEAQA